LREITVEALDQAAETLIFNCELNPSQLRAIADQTELKVIDRTMLILDIFAQHARSKGGKIQVELAQLRYLLPRLVGKGTALSRLAGGIGTRGPGETKLEVDRRRIRHRIGKLEKDLSRLTRERKTRRKRRGQDKIPIVSIVGYTNVGKSTLLNSLTASNEIAENMLFATLDPVSRKLTTQEGVLCILTDTVGLIHDLPPELKRAFAATFEEINDADLIVHLADASHPNLDEQILTVEDTLEGMDLSGIPEMLVLNKADLVESDIVPNLERRYNAIAVSAKNRKSLGRLVKALGVELGNLRS
jgi:GTP-binding protein HflX